MDTAQMSANDSQLVDLSCREIEDFMLKDFNASDHESSKNMTREAYILLNRLPYCEPKPYPTAEGIEKWIIVIILISFLIFGLIGNCLSATIMFRRSRRGLSSYFYLALLAITDVCVLYTGCLLFLLDILFGYHPQIQSQFLCRLAFYIQHLVTCISAWLIVAVTFERFIVVRYPFQSIRLCRMHVAYSISIIIFLFFSSYAAHYFFTVDILHVDLRTDEGYHPDQPICDTKVHRKLLSFIDLCLYSVIPSILILIFNILIIIAMFHALKKRRDYLQANSYTPTLNSSPRNKNKSSSTIRTQFLRSRSAESSPAIRSHSQTNKQRIYRDPVNNKMVEQDQKQNTNQKTLLDPTSATGIRLTCLLLLISFIFVVCTLPISIRPLIVDYLPSFKSTKRWRITQDCLTLLMFLNHAINFVFYCLTGRAFRSECRKLLCSLWFFKGIHISCTASQDSNKYQPYHHQQLVPVDRNRYIIPRQQQQQQQRINPVIKGVQI
ncbi:unnamed protein product [Adineta steineri]|uniref:G-protein coupled receptors family 1 profile domain-containing protein n=1 Tax=Adineta steineri TaxID=433720 RepID=A0A818IBR7_9BILA|nr:unnamed protein product [Adineta steineri]CAF3517054.1 unnamed protein product [Adineta steineri]